MRTSPQAVYAKGTKVSIDQSQQEIKTLLKRVGVSTIAIGEDMGGHALDFVLHGYRIRMRMPPLDRKDYLYRMGNHQSPTSAQVQARMEQRDKERYRALLLAIRSKLVNIANGFEIEEEFIAHIVNPQTGTTFYETHTPDLRTRAGLPPGGAPQLDARFLLEGGK